MLDYFIFLILQGKRYYQSPHPLPKTVGIPVFSDFSITAFSDSFFNEEEIPGDHGEQRVLSISEDTMKGWSFVSREQAACPGCPANTISCGFTGQMESVQGFL